MGHNLAQEFRMGQAAPSSPTLVFSPVEAQRMARREFQNPSILERETPRGRVWYIRYRTKQTAWVDGKPVIKRKEEWRELGLCSKMSKHQAERKKDELMRGVNGEVFTINASIPWEQFVEVFDRNHIAALAVPTQNNYRQQLKSHITPALKQYRLGQIGTLEVQNIFNGKEAELARQTRTTIRGVLRSAFTCARLWKLIDTDPMEGVNVGGGPRTVRECRIPTLAEVQSLMDLCDGDVPMLIQSLYGTGMRISEAAGLEVSDLDFVEGIIHVRRRRCRGNVADTKSEAGNRDLPMGNIKEDLAAHVDGRSGTVFLYNEAPIVDNALLDNYVTPRMVKLGIKFPGFGWHSFRRLHLSLMDQQGLTLFELRRQAGHSSIKTTQKYIADNPVRRAAAASGLSVVSRKDSAGIVREKKRSA
jgi:integrase